MKLLSAMRSGALVWLLTFSTFGLLSLVPGLKDSLDAQAIVVCFMMVPFAMVGASVYYRKGGCGNGIAIGSIMAATALVLDGVITVPFVEMPRGGSYQQFFSYQMLWLLVIVNISTVFFYWWLKVYRRRA